MGLGPLIQGSSPSPHPIGLRYIAFVLIAALGAAHSVFHSVHWLLTTSRPFSHDTKSPGLCRRRLLLPTLAFINFISRITALQLLTIDDRILPPEKFLKCLHLAPRLTQLTIQTYHCAFPRSYHWDYVNLTDATLQHFMPHSAASLCPSPVNEAQFTARQILEVEFLAYCLLTPAEAVVSGLSFHELPLPCTAEDKEGESLD